MKISKKRAKDEILLLLYYNDTGDTMREIKVKGIYRHFKGKYYIVEDIAYDSETMKQVVVYRQLYDAHKLFVRDLEMFLSEVDHNKYPNVKCKYRFESVGEFNEEN